MPQIKLQFSKSHGIGADLICWRDWSDYSHVDTVMPNGKLFGARSDGVKHRDPYPVVRKIVLSVDVTNNQEELFYAHITSQEGKAFDFIGLVGIAFNRNWENTDKWFCSELVMWALKRAGVNLLNAEKYHRISPQNILYSPLLKE